MNAYAVTIDTRTDRELTYKQLDMLTVRLAGPGGYNAAVACDIVERSLKFWLRMEAASGLDAITEALRVTGSAAREAGFGYEAEELRVLPFARLEEETMRLLSASDALTEFIEARIAEDEAVAKGLMFAARSVDGKPDFYGVGGPAAAAFWSHFNEASALREVTAKRAILARYQRAVAIPANSASSFVRGQDAGYTEACLDAIKDIAAVWGGHPGYRQEWAP